MMKLLLSIIAIVVVAASAHGQTAGTISVYADDQGATCNVLDLEEKTARSCMVPRNHIVYLNRHEPMSTKCASGSCRTRSRKSGTSKVWASIPPTNPIRGREETIPATGYRYEEGALVPDGSPMPTVENPVRELAPTG